MFKGSFDVSTCSLVTIDTDLMIKILRTVKTYAADVVGMILKIKL
jgi:hypothetical protein